MLERSLGGVEASSSIGDWNVRLCREDSAEVIIWTLVGAREETPGVGEALDRGRNDAQADQHHQRDEPAGVKDIGQAGGVEKAQHRRRVRALNVVGVGDRALQDDRPGRREDDNQYDQDYAGLDGTQ